VDTGHNHLESQWGALLVLSLCGINAHPIPGELVTLRQNQNKMTESEENPHLPANHVEIDLPTGLPKLSIEHLPDCEEERPARKSVTFLDSIMETKVNK